MPYHWYWRLHKYCTVDSGSFGQIETYVELCKFIIISEIYQGFKCTLTCSPTVSILIQSTFLHKIVCYPNSTTLWTKLGKKIKLICYVFPFNIRPTSQTIRSNLLGYWDWLLPPFPTRFSAFYARKEFADLSLYTLSICLPLTSLLPVLSSSASAATTAHSFYVFQYPN